MAGARAVQRTVRAAPPLSVTTLTLFAFSSDNWRRPPSEIAHLMRLFRQHLREEAGHSRQEGVRVEVIGRRDRLEPRVCSAIEAIESETGKGDRLRLRLAIDYSARDAILDAVHLYSQAPSGISPGPPSRDEFRGLLGRAVHDRQPALDVDLLIRTGGEQRLSDFLLWECAYAELVFTDLLWPDFDATALARAVEDFHRRDRRFGGLGSTREAVRG